MIALADLRWMWLYQANHNYQGWISEVSKKNERHEASHRQETCWKDNRWTHSFYTNMCVWFAKQGIETFFYQKGYRICPGRQPVCINLKLFILLNVLLPPIQVFWSFFSPTFVAVTKCDRTPCKNSRISITFLKALSNPSHKSSGMHQGSIF